jgi:hypothetical protein
MSMKKTDLVKSLAKKLDGQLKASGIPGRFAQGASEHVDKREQRRLDAAAGLVPFACKLPSGLAAQLREQAGAHAGGMNGLVAELLIAAMEPVTTKARSKAAKPADEAPMPAAKAARVTKAAKQP